MKKKNINTLGFTLVEIMLGILIVSIVIIGGFQALSAVMIGKVKLVQQTDIQKESFYFTQKLFEMIKKGGTIDYEEYFNRKVIGNTTYSSGHFAIPSGFGNFGSGGVVGSGLGVDGTFATFGYQTLPSMILSYPSFYYCRSGDGLTNKMTGTGCVTNFNSGSIDYTGNQQTYGQYSFQFIDYNSNYDNDNGLAGDEDQDGEIRWDDDDEYIGDGPDVFINGTDLKELYLISGNKKERTYFRWNVKLDPNAPIGYNCILDSSNNITGSGCLGTIEYLKLDGKDYSLSHYEFLPENKTFNDGVIDTWLINPEFGLSVGGYPIIAGSNNINYRVPLFPKSINVSEFKVYAYPNKDVKLAWKSTEDNINIAPYVDIKLKLKPSWMSRKKIKGKGKELDFSMTISLTDIYSK